MVEACARHDVTVVRGRCAHNGRSVLDVSKLDFGQLMELARRSGADRAFEGSILHRASLQILVPRNQNDELCSSVMKHELVDFKGSGNLVNWLANSQR